MSDTEARDNEVNDSELEKHSRRNKIGVTVFILSFLVISILLAQLMKGIVKKPQTLTEPATEEEPEGRLGPHEVYGFRMDDYPLEKSSRIVVVAYRESVG